MKKRATKIGVITAGLLTMCGGWLLPTAIAPLPAHAYISRIDVTLDIQAGETYETFLSRADAIARAAIQRSFDRDILISEVYAIVIGQRQGATVQVLSVQVSRNQWRGRPDTRRWATYYPSAKYLLGYGIPARNTPTTTTRPITPTPTVQVFPTPQPLVSPPIVPAGNASPVAPAAQPQGLPAPGAAPNRTSAPSNPLSPPASTPLPPVQVPRR